MRTVLCCSFIAALAVPAAARAEKAFRVHAEYTQRMASIRTVAIVAPDLRITEMSARNREAIDNAAWTERARENVSVAIEDALRRRGLATLRVVTSAPAHDAELEDVRAMYRAVVAAVQEATYEHRFTAQEDRFEYTVGELSAVVADDVDAVVLVWGSGVSFGSGRLFKVFFPDQRYADQLHIALVARDGDVLWYEARRSMRSDLRDPSSAAQLVSKAMKDLPEVKR